MIQIIVVLLLAITACTLPYREPGPVRHPHPELTGGVKEPTYPPDGPINCWVQPQGDTLWYPCPQRPDSELGQHGH